jgi:hypothetical protein
MDMQSTFQTKPVKLSGLVLLPVKATGYCITGIRWATSS